MPTAPKSRCLDPDCPEWAVSRGRCADHADRAWARPSANTRKLSGRDRERFRRAVLRRDAVCRAMGCPEPATEADHIIPVADGGANHIDNGQGLCTHHHDLKSRAEIAARNAARANRGT